MTIKNFKVGQTVYIMGDGRTGRNKFSTQETEVVKIGRKYLTVRGNWAMQFKETYESRPYLIEHVEYGEPRLLFPSREAANDYVECEKLKSWVKEAMGWPKIECYTLAQLREVKRILKEEPDHD